MKLTTWNIEHLSRPLANMSLAINKERLKNISNEILNINPDVLCLIEAPGNLIKLRKWINLPTKDGGLDGIYTISTIDGTEEILNNNPSDVRNALKNLYAMQGSKTTGNQWIWFLVKKSLINSGISATVQNPAVWQGMTGVKKWSVHYWGKNETKQANHWRHPQTLILKLQNGITIEVIGAHLKSKINRKSPFETNGKLSDNYIDEALRARIKLATEANDIRQYIEQRFRQEPDPRIIVCGDLNDGVGKEFFERQFLFFDLISNIQGNVFRAGQFMNHALFDYKEELRWSTEFNDRIELWARQNHKDYKMIDTGVDSAKKQLIDHILFTQAFVNGSGNPKINPKAGKVEHTIHEKINAGLSKTRRTSDHRPISVKIEL